MEASERIKFIQSKIDDAADHNGFYSAYGEELRWLIEQAERADIYKKALMEIGSNKFSSPESRLANEALFIADSSLTQQSICKGGRLDDEGRTGL